MHHDRDHDKNTILHQQISLTLLLEGQTQNALIIMNHIYAIQQISTYIIQSIDHFCFYKMQPCILCLKVALYSACMCIV